jgi:hypothetical protein
MISCDPPLPRNDEVERSSSDGMTDQRLAGLLDQLAITDCLPPTDRAQTSTANADRQTPDVPRLLIGGEFACIRAVDSFSTTSSLLRHRIGHGVWKRLIGQSDDVGTFWNVFGVAPIGMQEEAEQLSEPGTIAGASTLTMSAGLEQWAEAFDSYLLILDIARTAARRGLLVLDGPYDPIGLPFAAIFDLALPYLGSILVSARCGAAVEHVHDMAHKLTYIHGQVAAHGERSRFCSLGSPP